MERGGVYEGGFKRPGTCQPSPLRKKATVSKSAYRTRGVSCGYYSCCTYRRPDLLLLLHAINHASHLASTPKSDPINGRHHRHPARLDPPHNSQKVRCLANTVTGRHLLDVCPSTEGSLGGPGHNDHRYRVVALRLGQGIEYAHTYVVADGVKRRLA